MWNFLEPQVVETSDHTNKTNNKYLYHPNAHHTVVTHSRVAEQTKEHRIDTRAEYVEISSEY